MIRLRCIFLFILAGIPVARADDTIYVYARRQRPAAEIGSAVSVITQEDLERGQFGFVADALTLAPGVTVARNGGAGGFAGVRLRGSSSGQTLVLIDGIVVNDPSAPQGGFNFANLDVADIERIEILRGPQSIIYGADAIGGVIAIRTKRDEAASSAYAEGGSRGTARGGVTLAAKGDGAYARATLSGARTDGLSRAAAGAERDGYRTIAGSLSAGASIGADADVSLFARAAESRAEIDGFPPPFFTLGDTAEIEDTTDYAASVRLAHGRFDAADAGRLSGVLTLAASGVDRGTTDLGASTFAATGGRIGADYVLAARFDEQMSLEIGGDLERTTVEVSGVDEDAYAGAAFALFEASPHDRITLSAGARRDEFSNFSGATSARAAGALALTDAVRVRASWGEGFRAPTLFELNFDRFGVMPNPDLRPERATGIDAGVEISLAGVRAAATWFRQRVRDQIDFDFARNGYYNIDRVRSDGVEIEIDAALGPHASARFSYTFIDAEDALTGARLARTPKHSGAVGVVAAPTDRLSISATAFFNGEEADFPTPNDAFVRLDLRAAWSMSNHIEIYGRIENATDAHYEDVSGYAEPGASAFAGLRVRR